MAKHEAQSVPFFDQVKGIGGKIAGGLGKLTGIDTGGGGFRFSGSSSARSGSDAGSGSSFQFGSVNTGGRRATIPPEYLIGGLLAVALVFRKMKR